MEHSVVTSAVLPFLVFFPFLGAVVGYVIGRGNKGARDIWAWLLSAVVFGASLLLIGKETVFEIPNFCGLGISFAADGFGVILAVLTSAIWLVTTLFSKEYMADNRNRNRYYLFVFLTLGATMCFTELTSVNGPKYAPFFVTFLVMTNLGNSSSVILT